MEQSTTAGRQTSATPSVHLNFNTTAPLQQSQTMNVCAFIVSPLSRVYIYLLSQPHAAQYQEIPVNNIPHFSAKFDVQVTDR